MTGPLPPDPADVVDRYGHTEADHEAAGACQRPSMAARVAASRTELPRGSDAAVAFQRGWDAATAAVARSLPLHRTEAGYPRCATCDGGGCPDCTDPT